MRADAASMLLLMLSVNVFLGMVDHSMLSMDSNSQFFIFSETTAGNMTTFGTINSSISADYADAEVELSNSVDVGSGSSFTDSFRSTKTWWDKLNTGFGIASSVLRQPAGFMNMIGLPAMICTVFGILWYSLGLFTLIYLLTGRR